jgi:hypothetical protein
LVEYIKTVGLDPLGASFLSAAEQKNIDLLTKSQKDIDLLAGVYGSERFK